MSLLAYPHPSRSAMLTNFSCPSGILQDIVSSENVTKRLNSSKVVCLWRPPYTTTIGRPSLSFPCINILFWARSFGISDGDMEPFGTNSFLQLKYLRNIAEAFSTSRSLARKNLRIIKSSTSCTSSTHKADQAFKFFNPFHQKKTSRMFNTSMHLITVNQLKQLKRLSPLSTNLNQLPSNSKSSSDQEKL
nr:hypothetical protein Iba_chr13bCG3390 [Ipomoea batatas]